MLADPASQRKLANVGSAASTISTTYIAPTVHWPHYLIAVVLASTTIETFIAEILLNLIGIYAIHFLLKIIRWENAILVLPILPGYRESLTEGIDSTRDYNKWNMSHAFR